ncbi:transcriptional regulator family: HMG [Trichoderma aggressivum f. europaeum]|uniref:Transcriptional regulator family: HMG n=1 Tax=Trichoderma aggressivum f. europaeum TaxID=173218 RepID=A0AAE1IJB2_9HYPO|nr:transcriptional regulator family: HMG [Trichoderma aggressivum f. europaeum]
MQPGRMSQELEAIFRELGIVQYLDTFVEQGFDTWETILDIQESDLDTLGVKLGHRRKLQRRIANARGIDPSISLSSIKSTSEEPKLDGAHKKREPPSQGGDSIIVPKRKYRRHPKPDEHAPERPMSAYVLFSNKLRENLKGDRSLSFTEIAKLVGENWQSLPLEEREIYEAQARASKERFYREMAVYKETPEYRKYLEYLEEFNEKQAKPNQGMYLLLERSSVLFDFPLTTLVQPELIDSKLGNEDAKRARLEKNELLHGSSSAGSSTVGSSTAMGGSTSTISGSSSERMRESESREPPNLRHNSGNSILSASDSQHSPVASMPSPAATHFDVDMTAKNKSSHLRRGSSSLRGIAHQADVPQPYLPPLADMLAPGQRKTSGPVTENAGFMHGFATANPRMPVSHGTHSLPLAPVPPLYHEASSSGSSVPTTSSLVSRKLSDGHLSIHALLSDHDQTPHHRDESPSYTTSYVASPVERGRSAFGQFQGPKGYGTESFRTDKSL